MLTQPDWLRRPRTEDMEAYYPPVAAEHSVGGHALIGCEVTAEGALQHCRVESESPPGYGFGLAAVKMSQRFKMRPQTVDGRPVSGGKVNIPIRFDPPPPPEPWPKLDIRFDPTTLWRTLVAAYGAALALAVVPDLLRTGRSARPMGSIVEEARTPAWPWAAAAVGLGAIAAVAAQTFGATRAPAASSLPAANFGVIAVIVAASGWTVGGLAWVALRRRVNQLAGEDGHPQAAAGMGLVGMIWLGSHAALEDSWVEALIIVVRVTHLALLAALALLASSSAFLH